MTVASTPALKLGDFGTEILIKRHRPPRAQIIGAFLRPLKGSPITQDTHHMNKELPIIDVLADQIERSLGPGEERVRRRERALRQGEHS